jgi:hypothetical protein
MTKKMTNERERILAKIYKAVAFDDKLKGLLKQEWYYIYILFEEHREDEIPDAILEFIEGWIDTV